MERELDDNFGSLLELMKTDSVVHFEGFVSSPSWNPVEEFASVPPVIPAQPQPQPQPQHKPMPRVLNSRVANGKLCLKGNPGPWIENNPSSHRLVKYLELYFEDMKEEECEIGDSIHQLSLLCELTIYEAKSLKCLPNSMDSLSNLQFLNFELCDFEDLPANLGVFHTNLTHLSLRHCYNINSLPESIATLSYLSSLRLSSCNSLTELPPILGQLRSLQRFSLEYCDRLESLPANIMADLLNLELLSINDCHSLTQLPANLKVNRLKLHNSSIKFIHQLNLESLVISGCDSLIEMLPNLKVNHLQLIGCSIKSIPVLNLESLSIYGCLSLTELAADLKVNHLSLVKCSIKIIPLLNLESLSIDGCRSLTKLPANLEVNHLSLMKCSIKIIPSGLFNLRHFETTIDMCSKLSFANFESSLNLHHLTIRDEYANVKVDIQKIKANLNQLVHLRILSFRTRFNIYFIHRLPEILEWLNKLIILDIQDTPIKYLPWSITKLPNLQFLMLPSKFKLETLLFDLNDSVLISVKGRHVRKPWKQLKQEIIISASPITQGVYTPTIAPSGFLSLQEDLEQCIRDYYELRTLVKMLDLRLPQRFDVQNTKIFIGQLPNLTHLFVTDAPNKDFVPYTITGLKHLSFESCENETYSVELEKLSNLESLDLIHTTFSSKTNLPFSLRRLSLQFLNISLLPANIAKLTNLHTLELNGCHELNSLPPVNVVTLKIDRIIKSLPISLRNLEISHSECDVCFHVYREHSLTQLLNLEMLSVTCYRIKSLPSIAGQRNLRVLLLKDCFALKELPPDVEQLDELHTIDISGTRIASLSNNIIKLSKLQHLTLPKCFTQQLPRNFEEVRRDGTDRRYYECMGYYGFNYEKVIEASYKSNDAVVGSIEGPAGEQDDVTPQVPRVYGRKDLSDGFNHHAGCSSYNQDVEMHCNNNENSQQAPQNDEMCLMNRKNEQDNAACDTSNLACGEETDNSPSVLENEQCMIPQSDKLQKKKKIDISKEDILKSQSKMTLEVAAKEVFNASRSTLKRRLKEFRIKWPKKKQGKQNLNAKKRKLDSETHFSSNSLQQMVNSTRTTNNDNMRECAGEANLMSLTNNVQEDGSSNTFTVKATYYDDTVKFEFSLKYSIEQLEQEVGKRLKLEVGTFRMKYQDEDEDWIRMSCMSELEEPLRLSRSSGLKLSITDERFLNRGQHSQEDNGQLIPTKSEVRSTCLPINFEKEQLKHISCAGENSSQPTSRYSFPFPESWVAPIERFIKGHTNVNTDGHCGFRVIALFQYGDEEKWLQVRIDLSQELNTNRDFYRKTLGGYDEFDRANSVVNWYESFAQERHWFEATCLGFVVATKYQKVFTCWSNECCTYLPLVSRLVDYKPPTEYINMARINGNHFIELKMPTNIPLPPLSPLWKSHRDDTVEHWNTSIFKKQFNDYLQFFEGIPQKGPLIMA